MARIKSIKSVQKSIDQSLIDSMLMYPSSFSILNSFLSQPIPEYNSKYFSHDSNNKYRKILIKMNPLFEYRTPEGNEIDTMFQEDNFELLKFKLSNNLLKCYSSYGISLIEKCVFFNSEKCMNLLLKENVSISRKKIDYFEIGLMEYGALKGNRDIIKICLEEGQKILGETLLLGLFGHQNETVEWLIEEGKRRNHFDEKNMVLNLGGIDNIEFIEKMIKGININEVFGIRRFDKICH